MGPGDREQESAYGCQFSDHFTRCLLFQHADNLKFNNTKRARALAEGVSGTVATGNASNERTKLIIHKGFTREHELRVNVE